MAQLKELFVNGVDMEEQVDDLKNMFKVKTFTMSMTLNNGQGGNASTMVTMDGYTPLGMIEIDHDSDGYIEVGKWSIVNERAYIALFNNYSASRTFNVLIKVLYVKNSFASTVVI